MTTIRLITKIKSPIATVFDHSRDITLHEQSMKKSNEKAIAGVTSGLINKKETVTFRGKHFGIYLTHKSIISEMDIPNYFTDEMVKGQFKTFTHEHTFVSNGNQTVMIDLLAYETPFGILGKWFNKLFLKKYLTLLIEERNQCIKKASEANT